ncbi:MAG TPA: UDP-N-acetylglucosamine 2-epimerase (non-hydrolyzing) [Bryobacterales bacterium]|nr:UDP-N-acetylglucosamine 2-epimerase (non-hydrolyzing) [Bryobacterales bacterium]
MPERPLRVLFVFGTRPEAIKLCPLVKRIEKEPQRFEARVCVTAQHRLMLDQVLEAFQVEPHHDLDIMLPGQTLSQLTARAVEKLAPVVERERPDVVVVQGDTTTTFCAALAGFYARIRVAHVEAGLRTGDKYQPYPEEINRVLTTRLSDLHFAATEEAAANLRAEGVPAAAIFVTGNTVLDAVLFIRDQLESGALPRAEWPFLNARRKLIVVTAHRRESFGAGFERICEALAKLAERPDVEIVYPVHRNPNVQEPVRRRLAGRANIHLLEPLEYVPFVDLMTRSYLILSDSGGVQEEAPSLGKPVLVLREKTERPEAVRAGTVRLVGTDVEKILREANKLLDGPEHYRSMARRINPYGDGHACDRIAEILGSELRSP